MSQPFGFIGLSLNDCVGLGVMKSFLLMGFGRQTQDEELWEIAVARLFNVSIMLAIGAIIHWIIH
ncbi:MAG: hypothetical protein MI923_21505 [Phycisphaerales bacterium]|nr:hypothetical protein [Phycisphaerales bacterium]